MDKVQLAQDIRRTAKLTGSFELRSGQRSDTYFDKYLFESDPSILAAIAQHMAELIPPHSEVLCGLEMGGIPIVTALSLHTGIPAAFIRKQAKTYGTCNYAEGAELTGKRIVLVEDVVSSGGELLNTARRLTDDGINVDAAICVIDRQSGGVEALQANGIELRSLLTMEQIDSA